jgi:superoxide dismutase, Cu-Zn family
MRRPASSTGWKRKPPLASRGCGADTPVRLSASSEIDGYDTMPGSLPTLVDYNPLMKRARLFALLLPLLVTVLPSYAAAKLVVQLKDAQGKRVGTAILSEHKPGVELNLHLENLPPGEHAVHFHREPKCEAPDFKSAGPHFNPDLKKHGLDNPEGHHNGDNPNFTVGADGKAKFRTVNKDVTVGDDLRSLLYNGGTSIVIHANRDDQRTDPAGNAGDRIACGVITR